MKYAWYSLRRMNEPSIIPMIRAEGNFMNVFSVDDAIVYEYPWVNYGEGSDFELSEHIIRFEPDAWIYHVTKADVDKEFIKFLLDEKPDVRYIPLILLIHNDDPYPIGAKLDLDIDADHVTNLEDLWETIRRKDHSCNIL